MAATIALAQVTHTRFKVYIDLDAAPDHSRVRGVVVRIEPDPVVVTCGSRRLVRQPTSGWGPVATASSLPVGGDPVPGEQPSARIRRVLALPTQSPSWLLKSSGEVNVLAGKKDARDSRRRRDPRLSAKLHVGGSDSLLADAEWRV